MSDIYPLIINGSNVVSSTSNNTYTYNFPLGGVRFNKAKIAMSNLSLYYSWFNITSAYSNNVFKFTWFTNAGSTDYTVTVTDGFYTVSDLNYFLQQFCITNNLYLVNASGEYVYYLEFVTNSQYYSIQFNSYPIPTSLPAGWSNPGGITFPAAASTPLLIVESNAFRDIIGFNAGTYPAVTQTTIYSKISSFTPQISPVQSIVMTCSLLNNKYNIPSTVFYSFPITSTFGSLINSSPSQFSYIPIQDGNYNAISISFLDQDFNDIIINDTNLIVQLLIEE